MRDGVEDPSAGMRVISATLAALYSQGIVDVDSPANPIDSLPGIMDRALARATLCPFRTYADSLAHFARAICALRLDGGRCTAPGVPAGCGLYDPNDLYRNPSRRVLAYVGMRQGAGDDHTYIPGLREYRFRNESSFGMKLVYVSLHPTAYEHSLTLGFYGPPEADAEFRVAIWKLIDSASGSRPERIPEHAEAPDVSSSVSADGHLFYIIPTIDTAQYNRLALTITRVDADESSDPAGQYTIRLQPDADSDGDGLPDKTECPLGDPHCPDTDLDGYPDYLDPEHDDDGIIPGDAGSGPGIPGL
jgi:hypothetical protein